MNMQRQANRMTPLLPTQAYKTYAVRTQLTTHFRPARCAEIDCPDYLNGWYLKIDGTPQDLLHLATHSGKKYVVGEIMLEPTEERPTTEIFKALIFEAGQECFRVSTHVKSLERPEFFYVGRGDFRSFSTRRASQFDRADQFVDSFATHLDRIKTEIERG